MHTNRQLTFSFSILLGLQVITSLAAITLFGRMAPAIEDIIEDNVVSAEAVEVMLESVVEAQLGDPPASARADFKQALVMARGNVTETAEIPVLENIERLAPAAFQRDPRAVRQLVAELRTLGEINRRAMTLADQAAKRLGVAGAWAMVALGAGGFVIGLMTLRRLRRKLLVPLQELTAVLRSATSGDRLRRCTARAAPTADLSETMLMMNQLLDQRLEEEASTLRTSMATTPIEESALRTR